MKKYKINYDDMLFIDGKKIVYKRADGGQEKFDLTVPEQSERLRKGFEQCFQAAYMDDTDGKISSPDFDEIENITNICDLLGFSSEYLWRMYNEDAERAGVVAQFAA